MNALGYRLPVICLVGMGLVGCSAAGETSARPGSDEPLPVGATTGAWGETDSRHEGDDASNGDVPIGNGPDMAAGGKSSAGGPGNCDCGMDLPGVSIDQGDDGITIIIDLPNDGSLVLATKDGDCTTHDGGLDITGDVTVDLGNGAEVPLLDAELHVGIGGSMPTIDGSADVDGSLLDGIAGGAGGDLHVNVSLDPNVTQLMPESDALALLDLQLALPIANVGCGCFPALNGELGMADAKVVVSVDGNHQVAKVSADVAANADAIWTSMVPLHAVGKLAAAATLNDGVLVNVELSGDMASNANAMWCGLTPLASIELPSAKLTLDGHGATLSALVQASLHPRYSLSGEAQLSGSFAPDEWSLNLCGGVMADLVLVSAKATACLDLNASGARSCDKPVPS